MIKKTDINPEVKNKKETKTKPLKKPEEKVKKILFTGGGSGGHVTLNLSLIPEFLKNGWKVVYIGSKTGIERELVCKISGVRYYAIETGKLRRYFSVENVKDMFKVPVGIWQATKIIFEEKPNIIFSKGGFVSLPVVLGGFLNLRKIFMHESDVTPGLANKISFPFVHKFFTTFPETKKYVINKFKVKYVGPVLSDRLNNGSKKRALDLLGFDEQKPIIMFVGGSLGAKSLNRAVEKNIEQLLAKYQVIHICGKGQRTNIMARGYKHFEFVDKELKDFMAAADVVVSRSGSNAIFELWSLAKPMILVPLPSTSSRGEQSLNAQSFAKMGFAEVIKDEDLDNSVLFMNTINKVYLNRVLMSAKMKQSDLKHTTAAELYEEIVNG